ncbi:hypothetical protein [Microbispora sp. CA-102843]|uniref:hypothetical protein n=1 Tax=Microbispora sp. CA-102843 TaxID=3239952 RepID=UPI003D8C7E5D
MRDLPGFDAFAADQAQPLARTALSLTGDPEAARALVVTALSAVAARWRTVRWSFPTYAAREALYTAYLKRPRARGAARGPGSLTPGTDTAALAEALAGLTPRRRALVVACFHDRHTTWQAAGLCRMDARTANTETVLAVAELRNRLPASFVAETPPDEASSGSIESPTASEGSTPEGRPPETDPRRAAPDDEDAETGGAKRGATADPSPAPWASPSEAADLSPTSWTSPSQASGPSPASWASPSEAAGPARTSWASPGEAAGPARTSWASPGEAGQAPGPAAAPVSFATASGHTAPYHATPFFASPEAAPPAAPFAPPAVPASSPGSTGPDDRGDGPWEAALRRELAVLSAGMPALDPLPLAVEAARTGRRHGTRRRALATSMSVTLAALVVVPLAFGAAGLAERAGRSAAGASPGALDESAAAPTLPPSLPAPVRFAYRGFCKADDWDPVTEEFADNGCDQWRLVTTTGEQWRVADVAPDLSDGWQPLVAISRDGNRMAYYSDASSDFVVFDRHDTTAKRTGMVPLIEEVSRGTTHLVISPSGRWMAADFGPAAEAVSPRVQNLTSYRVSTLPRRMRVLAVADDGTVTGTATWDTDAPGRLTTTALLRVRPNGRTLSRTPIDSALFEAGAAVSPDGHAIAVAAERAHPAEDDHGLLVTLDAATGRVLTRHEAALPEDAHIVGVHGWASEHEVIVEAEVLGDDEDEAEYSIHAVDVRTGAARPIALDEAGGVPALWVPGALR